MKRSEDGFSVLEILVVVGVIGIIAAIAIFNYFGALDRAKQKRTVTDIRTIATAWESRQAEQQRYNAAGYTFPTNEMKYEDLAKMLVPTYTKDFPRRDGWQRPIQFAVNQPAGTVATEYAIRSAGRDGKFEESHTPGMTQSPDCDIVFANGAFVSYPDTVQTK